MQHRHGQIDWLIPRKKVNGKKGWKLCRLERGLLKLDTEPKIALKSRYSSYYAQRFVDSLVIRKGGEEVLHGFERIWTWAGETQGFHSLGGQLNVTVRSWRRSIPPTVKVYTKKKKLILQRRGGGWFMNIIFSKNICPNSTFMPDMSDPLSMKTQGLNILVRAIEKPLQSADLEEADYSTSELCVFSRPNRCSHDVYFFSSQLKKGESKSL